MKAFLEKQRHRSCRRYSIKWETKQVKDIFEIKRGNVLSKKEIHDTPDEIFKYPVYSSQTMNNGLLGYYKDYLYEDAITWTTDGANAGTVRFRPGKFYCTNVCGVLLSKEGNANNCVAEYLNSITDKYVVKTGNPKLMNNVMADIEIQLPSLEHQHLIASLLESYDSLISTTQSEQEHLLNIKQQLMTEIFNS